MNDAWIDVRAEPKRPARRAAIPRARSRCFGFRPAPPGSFILSFRGAATQRGASQ